MRHPIALSRVLPIAALVVACGGSDEPGAPPSDAGPALDASVQDAMDASRADAADTSVPDAADAALRRLAPWERLPSADYMGGALLTSPKIVTVTFAADNAQTVAQLQKFGDTITQTPWWTASTSEYCVMPAGTPCIGPGTSGGHVVLSEAAPKSLADSQNGVNSAVVAFIQSHVTSGALPPPDAQTLYVFYFPTGTSITLDGAQSCSEFGAYHYSAAITPKGGGAPVEVAYAIEPRCGDLNYTTFAASHEIIEAATDAHPGKDRGYVVQDRGWVFYGDELGDMCDLPWDFLSTNAGGFNVQRGWSTKSARAGHDPCVPAPQGSVYFNVAPEAGYQTVYLSPKQSVTFDLEAYADGPVTSWTLSAEDISKHVGGNPSLAFAFDKTTIKAGETAKLTVTLTRQPDVPLAPYVIHSQSQAGHHYWGATILLK